MAARRKTRSSRKRKIIFFSFLTISIIILIAVIIFVVFMFKKANKERQTERVKVEDTTPPMISGTKDQSITVGDTISYRKDVIVTDDMDSDVKLEIDNSKVNLNKAGVYPVVYNATDSSGNTSSEEIKITVKEKVDELVEGKVCEMADEILNQITDSSMSQHDKAWNIYKWVQNNISYVGNSKKTDWITGAYTGFKDKKGDCLIFFAVTKALLTRADIPNIDVTRVGGQTDHYWHLVDIGQGWYHYDTTPQKDYLQVFLLNDAEVADYTARSDHNYYTFDESLYPKRGQ